MSSDPFLAQLGNDESFRALFEHSRDTLVVVDAQAVIRMINRTPQGLAREEVLGTSVLDWMEGDDRVRVERTLAGIFRGGDGDEFILTARTPQGPTRWYVQYAPLRIEGVTRFALAVASDITERGQAKLDEQADAGRKPGESDILVVDDQAENLRVLAAILEGEGHRVRKALGGQQALAALKAQAPDLILLDVNMPEMSGFQVCAELKRERAHRDIPVIFVSGLADVSDKVEGFEVGGVDYITKPFQHQEVAARVRTHLTINRQQRKIHALALDLAGRNALLEIEVEERRRAEAALEQANQRLQSLSLRDELTQVANRRAFDQYLAHEWSRAMRDKTSIALLMCDLDEFKRFNDRLGHQAGDACLTQVAAAIRDAAKRPADMTARYGGEEFAVILPGTNLAGAVKVAQAIQGRLAGLALAHPDSPFETVTCSIGAAAMTPDPSLSAEVLVAEADRALFRAKAEGRNRVVASE